MDTTSKWFNYLHTKRNLSEDVVNQAQLFVRGNRLGIPIFDDAGNHLFSKMRRPFDSEEGPKYTYDAGSTAYLYGLHFHDLGTETYYVEGELDVLAMRTIGYNAYTSTGGALTFKPEWLTLVPNRTNVILFDNDDTGIKGAVKLAKILGHGYYTWVPPVMGKDISDMLSGGEPSAIKEILNTPNRRLPFDVRYSNSKEGKEVVKKLRQLANGLDLCVGRNFILQLAYDIHNDLKLPKARPRQSRPDTTFDSDIERAKAYPVENLLQFRNRKHTCLWHNEKTASLHLYPDNKMYCHGSCARMYDAIDVYMHQNPGMTFIEAVKALNQLP